jgi:tetratricopeptide (TPR) repeat protein
MKLRLLMGFVLALSVVPYSGSQVTCSGDGGEGALPARASGHFVVPTTTVGCDMAGVRSSSDRVDAIRQPVAEVATRAETMRRIGVYEAALRGPGVASTRGDVVAKAYTLLASLYEDVAMNDRAEAALKHSIALSRGSAEWSGELATGLNDLGLLHAEQGRLHEAEKEQLEALRLRESLGDSLDIARSWSSLSGLYFKEHKYRVSREFAQRAMEEFSANNNADVVDKISSRLYLSMAMCYSKDCPAAVPVLKDAIDMAKSSYKSTDFPVGEGKFLLGFAYWKAGDTARASAYMQEGTAIMKVQLGWGHPSYLNALGNYARFLRENRREDDAEAVEREIRQAESVVDVRSLPTRGGANGLAGLR